MKRRIPLSAAIVLVLLGALITFLITDSFISRQFQEKLNEIGADQIDYQKLSTVDAIVREHYAKRVSSKALDEGTIAGYITGLGDEHSRYLTAEEYAAYSLSKTKTTLYETGISAAYDEKENRAYIYYVDANSPAAKAGVLKGDYLLGVNGVTVAASGFEAVHELLYGEEGAAVTVSVARGADESRYALNYAPVVHDLVFGEIAIGQTAHIRIFSFEATTKDALKTTIDTMIEKGADSLVFDLRGVKSLGFDAAVACVDVLAGEKDLAKYVTAGGTVEVLTGDGDAVPLPCAVLIDKHTSGAPELFAACLHDTIGALLVGDATDGCASVQADIKLSDMSAIILTTKIYEPPVSESYETVGVTPTHAIDSFVDFRTHALKDDAVFLEAYYLLKPAKRPVLPEDDPTLSPQNPPAEEAPPDEGHTAA